MSSSYTFSADDMMNPVYCKQCRNQIPKAVSLQGNGVCPDCMQISQQAQASMLQQHQVAQAQQIAAKRQPCPVCGHCVSVRAVICPECGEPLTADQQYLYFCATRYENSYRIAQGVTHTGTAIIVIGAVVSVITFCTYVVQASGNSLAILLAMLCAAVICTISYMIGNLVSSMGELLKAALDGSVYTSPFLTNDQKIKIMSS